MFYFVCILFFPISKIKNVNADKINVIKSQTVKNIWTAKKHGVHFMKICNKNDQQIQHA